MPQCCASRPAHGSGKRAKGGGPQRRRRDEDALVRRTGGGEGGDPVPVVLLGEESCGKTSLLQRFTAQEFRLKNEVNMGAALTERVVIVRRPGEPARAVQLNIWDTPGSTKVHHLAHLYYKAAEAAVAVYDLTSMASFEIMKSWVAELKSLGPRDIRLIIAANKCDCDERREVPADMGAEYAREAGAKFFEVSARTGKGVDKVFKEAAQGALPVISEQGDGRFGEARRARTAAAGGAGALRAVHDAAKLARGASDNHRA